jgi:hypothetical protein
MYRHLQRASVPLLSATFLVAGCATGPKPNSPVQSGFKPVLPQVAALQTRHFHRVTEAAVLDAAHAVLQDLGYQVAASEAALGAVAASKSDVHRVPLKPLQEYLGTAAGFGLIAAFSPVLAGVGVAGITYAALTAEKKTDPDGRPLIPTRDYPCIDRVLLTTVRGGTEEKCCNVRVVIQRTFPEAGTDRYAGGWVVADATVHQEFFNRLAAKLAASPSS